MDQINTQESDERDLPSDRNSLASAALIEGERDLVRKAMDIAMAGDVQMLKFLLGVVLPRQRAVTVDLPLMDCANDVLAHIAAITSAVSEGKISPREGQMLATIANTYSRAMRW